MILGGLYANQYFKGLNVLLEALYALRDRADWELIVVGDGDLRAGYEQQAQALGLGERVRFLGKCVGESAKLYRESDVFVFPSVDRSEAFGLVALEAMASGTAVIASDLDGVRFVVEDGRTGILVPPGDASALAEAIVALLDDPAQRVRMGEQGRARAEELFTWDKHVTLLEEVYD